MRGKRGVLLNGRALLFLLLFPLTSHLLPLTGPLACQSPPAISAERAEYARWLSSAPVSPYAAVAQTRIGSGVHIGPANADIPLAGVPPQLIIERHGHVVLSSGGSDRTLPRDRPVALAGYQILASGPPGRTTLTIFGKPRAKGPPDYFPYDSSLAVVVALEPPSRAAAAPVLALDGTEVEAAEAGTVSVRLGATTTRLLVRRIPTGPDESDLEIYFRDATSGHGSYPAGRFVSLIPRGNDRYLLDFNRARNPFCAYSSVYACPAPWRGNTLASEVRAGERYNQSEK